MHEHVHVVAYGNCLSLTVIFMPCACAVVGVVDVGVAAVVLVVVVAVVRVLVCGEHGKCMRVAARADCMRMCAERRAHQHASRSGALPSGAASDSQRRRMGVATPQALTVFSMASIWPRFPQWPASSSVQLPMTAEKVSRNTRPSLRTCTHSPTAKLMGRREQQGRKFENIDGVAAKSNQNINNTLQC